jgi:site-specific recombinase XerD
MTTHFEAPQNLPPPVVARRQAADRSRAGRTGTDSMGDVRPAADLALPQEDMAFPEAPLGGAPATVRLWFDRVAAAAKPDNDGSLAAAHNSARAYRSRAKADNTRTAYRAAVRAWCHWCDRHQLTALPATSHDIAAFLAAGRDRGQAGNTLRLRVAAIRFLHRAAGLPTPTDTAEIAETMAGIRRDAPNPRQKRAATLAVLRELLAPIPDDVRGRRDRALLLVGFAGALRRSELAGIACADLQRTDRGYELTLARTKGSPTDAVLVPLPYGQTELCPVRALARWLDAAALTEGPVFRRIWRPAQAAGEDTPLPVIGAEPLTARSIARIIQARAAAAGFVAEDFGGHSLKRGALTAGMQAGAPAAQLRRLGRHKSFAVLGAYLEFGNLFDGHALAGLL